ncbi:MAG: leucine--tRNA ligase, partial [Bacteroidetes bacterium]|nr:leucine--tRNA ligase [Bacteroidota bacterium]
AEQYAIETGQHPAITTEKNIIRYREQLDRIGFSFDWAREVRTCDPSYYKWTQWTFVQLFNHWYNKGTQKPETIEVLISHFEKSGTDGIEAARTHDDDFTADQWNSFSEEVRHEKLMYYRMAYLADEMVNWCPALGTVLANDEVSEGFSVRGGHPVERKLMKQWLLRISAYSQRLLDGLDKLDWPDSIKEIQRNWIGRSEGAMATFGIQGYGDVIEIFTTRPDTMYGATFMVLAPEHELVTKITTDTQRKEVDKYTVWAKNRPERERMTDVNRITGVFTGAYGINPLTNNAVPIWIADYVLMGYGTGAIMAVPAHDSRDFKFARHFNLPIIQVVVNAGDSETDPATWDESYDAKEGIMVNSGIINGMEVKPAISAIIRFLEEKEIGYGKINFRLRDAIFSRQRYWGEPFPVYYKNGLAYVMEEKDLPLELPEVDKYLPTESGEPPLARAKNWKTPEGYPIECSTMPGFAGSSAYYLRYMDPRNDNEYFSKEANQYWRNVDLYIGGAEHATGHLIYARFWNKFLFDLGYACEQEPFKKLINQGMIQGRSSLVYRVNGTNKFVSAGLRNQFETTPIHVDVSMVTFDVLDVEAFKQWRAEYANAEFVLEDGKFVCGFEVEKMSKSLHNVVNPDELIEKYGADALRLYEMFLGPIEMHKPWDTNGIEGVSRFIKKFWRLFHNAENEFSVSDEAPTNEELKVLHKTIKKISEDIERFSFNTSVSEFMICTNRLQEIKCNKRAVLQPLVLLISPFAPHLAEELWQQLGNSGSAGQAEFPKWDSKLVVDDTFTCPVSFNGKMRFTMELAVGLPNAEVEKIILEAPESQKWLDGKAPRKIIVVPNKIVNVVV